MSDVIVSKKRRHILETHWLALSMLIVILAKGHGSGSVDRQWSNSDVTTGNSLSFGLYGVVSFAALPLLALRMFLGGIIYGL